jgi:streptomycin 6-kinase
LVIEAADRWGLTDLHPVDNLTYNYVLTGLQDKKPIILKLILETKRLHKEAQALEAFSGLGGISMLAKAGNALLLERILPGYSLRSYLPHRKNEALKIICEIMKRLHQAPIPKLNKFPHIKDLLTTLDNGWNIPVELLKKARSLKRKFLQAENEAPLLLHGDLQHSNILWNGKEWKVIDPHGVIGYPVNEIWAFIIDPLQDTQLVAEYLNLDVVTVREWYFIHLILLVCWNIHDPNLFLDLAKKTYSLI